MTAQTAAGAAGRIALPRRWAIPVWGMCLAGVLAILLVYFTLTTRHFAGHGAGMLALSEQFNPTGIIALGLAVVILTGCIDLSVGANASLAAIVTGLGLEHHQSPVLAIVFGIAAATGVGLVNGIVVAGFGIDSLLVTLATQFIVTSLGTSLAGASPPYGFSSGFQQLGHGAVLDVPIDLLAFLAVGAAVIVLVNYTALGRSLRLIGYNPRAARYTGLNTGRSLVAAFTLCGLACGVAGVLLASYYNDARADTGTSLLLPAITAAVLGGIDIFGGRGRIGEVIVAVFLLGYLTQGMLISGYSSLTTTMVTGLVLIVSLVVKVAVERAAPAPLRGLIRNLRHLSRASPPPESV